MNRHITETMYPLNFREEDCVVLGRNILHRHTTELVGMRRVGISNFLRFFLHRTDVVKKYVHPSQKHLFIPVDLNDLFEREISTFWRLTLKRIVDLINENADLTQFKDLANKKYSQVQRNDIFDLVDTIRDLVKELVQNDFFPTIFFLRYDRLKDVLTEECFSNLQGMIDATNHKLAYVFTSYRELNTIRSDIFDKQSLLSFSHKMYLKPALDQDMEIILTSLQEKYSLNLSDELIKTILKHSTGHVQYLHLMIFLVNEHPTLLKKPSAQFIEKIEKDERITLQSEELYEALTEKEKQILLHSLKENLSVEQEYKNAPYVFDTGYLQKNEKNLKIFNPFFEKYMNGYLKKPVTSSQANLTKKEQLLYELLKSHPNEICEREEIIRHVWAECSEIGVSDWAVDRLISRLRTKLNNMEPNASIKTVKTRGFMYMLAEK
jgi:DNA-binding winged helix-turn-helix (wHTH) protein